MKTLRTSLAALGLALGSVPAFAASEPVPTPPQAQPNLSAEGRPGRPMMRRMMKRRAMERERLAERLDLTDDQQAQLKTMRANTAATAKAIREDTSLTPEEKKTKLRETWKASQTEMRALLTPEQQAKLDQMRQHARRGANRRTSL